jgi:hypothetical protein
VNKKTLLALAGGGALAYWLWRKSAEEGGAVAEDSLRDKLRPGEYDPTKASDWPDFGAVTDGVSDTDPDWMQWVVAPGYDQSFTVHREVGFYTNPYNTSEKYYKELWLPASRISINTLTVGDFDRAAFFLGSAWKRSTAAGCTASEPEKRFREINADLEDVASGLEIGASIGIGLASIFGYGAGAKASDSAFGFQRGADETRKAQIDLESLPATLRVDLQAMDIKAAVRVDPAGHGEGSNVIGTQDHGLVGCPSALFSVLWQQWNKNWADIGVDQFRASVQRYIMADGSPLEQARGLEVWFGTHVSQKLGTRENGYIAEDGQYWIRRDYNFPWLSREMGCVTPYTHRVYTRARMLRTIDLIRTVMYPTDAVREFTGQSSYDPILTGFVEGSEGPEYDGQYVSFGYQSNRFGSLRGTIFPAVEGDAEIVFAQTDANANFVAPGSDGYYVPNDLPPIETLSTFVPPPEPTQVITPVTTTAITTYRPYISSEDEANGVAPLPMPAPTSTSAGAPSSSSGSYTGAGRFSRLV